VLAQRLMSAAVILVVVFGFLGLDLARPLIGQPGAWLLPIALLSVLGTAYEFSRLLAFRWPGVHPRELTLLCGLGFWLAAGPLWGAPWVPPCSACAWQENQASELAKVSLLGGLVALVIGWGWLTLRMLIGLERPPVDLLEPPAAAVDAQPPDDIATGLPPVQSPQWQLLVGLALSCLVLLYVVGLAAFWPPLRLSGPQPLGGWLTLIGVVATIKVADAAAYFTGRSFGGPKLVPRISPNKTISGLLGGIVGSLVLAELWFGQLSPVWLASARHSPWWGPALLGALLALVGLLGDLFESSVKRACDAKDSGTSLPGLGGVWDVTDSLFPGIAAAYAGIQFGWIQL
jgi:phosphatidate cytidylyltransferase